MEWKAEKRKTSLGEAWFVSGMAMVDEDPRLLESGLPVFLEEEAPIMAALDPAARATFWRGRLMALASERELRAADPKRTVFRGTKDRDELAEMGL